MDDITIILMHLAMMKYKLVKKNVQNITQFKIYKFQIQIIS